MIRTWTPENSPASISPERQKVVEVREWLSRCRYMTQEVENQRDKIRRLKAASTQTTQSFSGMPGGGGSGDKIGKAAACIIDEEIRLKQREAVLRKIKDEAYRRILWPLGNDPCYTSRMVDFLEGYYLDCASTDSKKRFQLVTYEQLAGRKSVDVSTVKKSMRRAVQILALYWDAL